MERLPAGLRVDGFERTKVDVLPKPLVTDNVRFAGYRVTRKLQVHCGRRPLQPPYASLTKCTGLKLCVCCYVRLTSVEEAAATIRGFGYAEWLPPGW